MKGKVGLRYKGRTKGGREKTRVFQIMDFSFFVKKRGFAGGGSKSQNT